MNQVHFPTAIAIAVIVVAAALLLWALLRSNTKGDEDFPDSLREELETSDRTLQPGRDSLSMEHLTQMAHRMGLDVMGFIEIARAVEREHGIGGEPYRGN